MRNIIAVATVTLLLIAAPLRCSADQTPAPQGATLAASASPSNDKDALPPSQQVPATITRLLSSSGPITGKDDQGHPAKGSVGLNEDLLVQVAPAPPYLDASKYALFFDGREVKGLDEPVYDRARQSLVFRL